MNYLNSYKDIAIRNGKEVIVEVKQGWIVCPTCKGDPVSYNQGGFITCSQCGEIGFVRIKKK